jgi:hypothetical protein
LKIKEETGNSHSNSSLSTLQIQQNQFNPQNLDTNNRYTSPNPDSNILVSHNPEIFNLNTNLNDIQNLNKPTANESSIINASYGNSYNGSMSYKPHQSYTGKKYINRNLNMYIICFYMYIHMYIYICIYMYIYIRINEYVYI